MKTYIMLSAIVPFCPFLLAWGVSAGELQAPLAVAELAAMRGGQQGTYPPGPGGPCANGVGHLCENGTVACTDSPCEIMFGAWTCPTFLQRVQSIQGWTECSYMWPSGWFNCVLRPFYCTTTTVCGSPSDCPPDPLRGGTRYCTLGTHSYGSDKHDGGDLTGGGC